MALNKTWVALVAVVYLACACTTTTNGVQTPKIDLKRAAAADTELAAAYYHLKKYQIAIDESNEALTKMPDYAPAYNLLGLIYMALPDVPQAETYFRKALSLNSNDPDINHNFGVFLCENGRAEESLDYFKRAYSNVLYETPEKSLDNAGLCLLKLKRPSDAQALFETALTKSAQDTLALYNLADLSYKNSDLLKAQSYLYRLDNASDKGTAEHLMLGWRIERAMGNITAADQYAHKLKQAFPDSPQAKQLND